MVIGCEVAPGLEAVRPRHGNPDGAPFILVVAPPEHRVDLQRDERLVRDVFQLEC